MAASDKNLIASEITLPCGLTLKNRMVKAAMTECLADDFGRASKDLERLYSGWAAGGCSLLVTGNVQVDRRYLERPGNVCIDGVQEEKNLDALRKYATAAKQNGTKCFVQLSHPGRQASLKVAKASPAPSAIPSKSLVPLAKPFAMTTEQVQDTIKSFAAAAKVCKDVGFDGVQIHSAHGYLFSAFLSPLSNKRTDQYGGNVANRARALLETIRAVREAVGPTFAVSVKMNSSDFQRGGFSHEDALTVADWLDDEGLDLVEISGGNYESPALLTGLGDAELDKQMSLNAIGKKSTRDREAYFLKYAEDIKARLKKTPLMVTGGFRSRKVMESALEGNKDSGTVDLIGIARPLCVELDCVQKLLDHKIDVLPSPETDWHLPWYAQWMHYVVVGNLLKVVGDQASTYTNLRRAGQGLPMLRSPNVLYDVVAQEIVDFRKAWSIKGLPKNDPTVQQPMTRATMIKYALILVTALFFFSKARSALGY